MYDMDLRQYDPAIGRWVVQDPITHHSQSPYNAFDSNPAFWADPSGADASTSLGTDMYGNTRYNENGLFVPMSNRLNGGFIRNEGHMSNNIGGGSGNIVYSDNNGTWYRKLVGTIVTGVAYDNLGNPEEIEYQGIYENYYAPNVDNLDGLGMATNVLAIMWGGTQLGVNKLRQANLAKKVASFFEIGTQAAASRLKNFTKILGKWGNTAGAVGYGLSVYSIGSKIFSGEEIKTSEKISFGINTGLLIAGSIISGPLIPAAALIYGIVEIGSYIYNGKSIEQNILGE